MGSLYSGISLRKDMSRLQCRSYPLGAHIIIDGEHKGEVTPFTFDGLPPGEHEIEMQYVEADSSLMSKKEKITLQEGKRMVCKLYFKEPKTLATPQG